MLILKQQEGKHSSNNEYKVDLWCEFKKRWILFGVLVAVAMAVLAPKYGAFGGFFHWEYLSFLPLSCVYFNAGRVHRYPVRIRVYALTAFHANIASVILCAVSVNALSVAIDRRVMEGVMLASSSGPCVWLSLSLVSSGVTPSLAACSYLVSLLTVPLTHLVLCGRAPFPSLEELKAVLVTAVLPYLVGTCAVTTKDQYGPIVNKLSALLLLYVDCCSLLLEAESALYVSDVITTLVLVSCWLSTVAAASFLYVKCRVLDMHEAQLLLLTATPKSTRIDWITSTCPRAGLYRLPAVFLAPAQALLLSAIFYDTESKPNLPT